MSQYKFKSGVHHVNLGSVKHQNSIPAVEKKLQVSAVNVQPFGSNFDKFMYFMNEINLDIIGVTESHVDSISVCPPVVRT